MIVQQHLTNSARVRTRYRYTTLYASSNPDSNHDKYPNRNAKKIELVRCRQQTTGWKSPGKCTDVEVTQYVSSSGALALTLDASSIVENQDYGNPWALEAEFSLKISGSAAAGAWRHTLLGWSCCNTV